MRSSSFSENSFCASCRPSSHPRQGNYLFTAAGGQGGTTSGGALGGLGATITATVFLEQGAIVPIIVSGQGGSGGGKFNQTGAGGGGLTAVYTDGENAPSIVAGTVSRRARSMRSTGRRTAWRAWGASTGHRARMVA